MPKNSKASREAAAAAPPPPPPPAPAGGGAAPKAGGTAPKAPVKPQAAGGTAPKKPTAPAAPKAPAAPAAPAAPKVPATTRSTTGATKPVAVTLAPGAAERASAVAAGTRPDTSERLSMWFGEDAKKAREAARRGATAAPRAPAAPAQARQRSWDERARAAVAPIQAAPFVAGALAAETAAQLLKTKTAPGQRYALATTPQTGEYGDAFTRMHQMRRSGLIGTNRRTSNPVTAGADVSGVFEALVPSSTEPSVYRTPVRSGAVTETLTPKEGRPVTLTANLQLPSARALYDRDQYKEEVSALGARYNAASARLEALLAMRRDLEAARDAAGLAKLAKDTRATQQELVDIRASLPEYGMDPQDAETLKPR